jgi:hypothetical protein
MLQMVVMVMALKRLKRLELVGAKVLGRLVRIER